MSYATYDQLPSVAPEDKPIKNITSFENFEQKKAAINNHSLCVVDMYGDWCGPCKQIAPKFAELASKYNKKNVCLLAKENVDLELPNIPNNLEIHGVPTFLFYVNGHLQKNYTVTGGDMKMVEQNIRNILNI